MQAPKLRHFFQRSVAGNSMLGRAFVIWLGLLVLSVVNGAARESLLHPWLGQQGGHILSTIVLCVLIWISSLLTISWIGPRTRQHALLIGLFWLMLTVAFEFLAGHYLFGNPWRTLLADYNVVEGRIWPMVLLATLISPGIAHGRTPRRARRR